MFTAPVQFNEKGGKAKLDSEGELTPTPTRPSTPQRRFPAVKSIFATFVARGIRQAHPKPERIAVVQTPATLTETMNHGLLATNVASDQPLFSSAASYESSELDDTPPLTPESLIVDIAQLPALVSEDQELDYIYNYRATRLDDDILGHEDECGFLSAEDGEGYTRPLSLEIKEGKKPARPINYDALLADLPSDADGADALSLDLGEDFRPGDDKDEWYGLEYTLQLSTRERHASETHAFSAGEHSKSRESWAAIHQGMVHPFFEEEEFHCWKNWHNYLDRQDEKRRHRRGRAFRAQAKELALMHADEVHIRDLMAWQMEMYGEVGKKLLEQLRLLTVLRPLSSNFQDPYYPPKKHDVAWHLKRSRSIATLRELRAPPESVSKSHAQQ
ncbi:hypothetical protein GGX14DRAFT_539045 [Mycena pura]|uniref:Uncharacterized protein n=1 Tax=Mycena pura TaxID=153505 RepID=A0AAD6YUM4_9AGAR|nr:hypothetical protein GGX14DRAFT_539045 [Mycena pura]